jgi:hypothetical protein
MKPTQTALAAAVLSAALLTGCSADKPEPHGVAKTAAANAGDEPRAEPKPDRGGQGRPKVVTKTVEVLPASCADAIKASATLARRVDYYPILVHAAAQSEGWPRLVLRESSALTRDVNRLIRASERALAKCQAQVADNRYGGDGTGSTLLERLQEPND